MAWPTNRHRRFSSLCASRSVLRCLAAGTTSLLVQTVLMRAIVASGWAGSGGRFPRRVAGRGGVFTGGLLLGDRLRCVVDVPGGKQAGKLAIARNDGTHDGRVLFPILLRAFAAMGREDDRGSLTQGPDHVPQCRVRCDLGECFVEVVVGLVELGPVGFLGDPGPRGQDLFELPDFLRVVA